MHCLGKVALLGGTEGIYSKFPSAGQEIPGGLVKGHIPVKLKLQLDIKSWFADMGP